jgi:hypothetical protein
MIWSATRCLIGVILAGIVIWLGLKTATAHPDPAIVALFGISAALLGPTAISLIAGTFTSKRDEAFKQLAKAGEIEQKVAQATTVQEKLKALEDERRQLSAIVRLEARREAIQDRQKILKTEVQSLVDQAEKTLAELKEIEAEGELLHQGIDNSSARTEVMAVRFRLLRETVDARYRLLYRLEGSSIGSQLAPYLLLIINTFSIIPFMGWVAAFLVEATMTIMDGLDDLRTRRLVRELTHTKDNNSIDDKTSGD